MIARERITAGAWLAPWLRYQHLARYEWAASFAPGRRMLDAACANAYGSVKLVTAGATHVVALDIALEAIVEARAIYRRDQLSLMLGDGSQLPFRDGAFDVFVSFETIEHLGDDRAYVAEARRVVREGGLFLCSTPNRRLVNAGNSIEDRPFNRYHTREYTQPELAALLEKRFSSVEWFGQSAYPRRYGNGLVAIGRRWRGAAIRLHQLRKLSTIAFESMEKHRPFRLPIGGEPEVLIALCR